MSNDPLTESPLNNLVNGRKLPVWPVKFLFNIPSFGSQILIHKSLDPFVPLTKQPLHNVDNDVTISLIE